MEKNAENNFSIGAFLTKCLVSFCNLFSVNFESFPMKGNLKHQMLSLSLTLFCFTWYIHALKVVQNFSTSLRLRYLHILSSILFLIYFSLGYKHYRKFLRDFHLYCIHFLYIVKSLD